MTQRYNLIDEPWIPLRVPGGAVVEAGLGDALCGAREYEALAEPSPVNLAALHRLLLALLSRCLADEKWDRAKWWHDGLPRAAIRAGLARVRDRFWVFHPETPFMQAPFLATHEKTKDCKKPWSHLALEKASGSACLLFDHSMDNTAPAIPTGDAVRNMLGDFQFHPAGFSRIFKTADKSGPLSDAAAVIPMGKSLHETLLLSLHKSEPNDLPAWERRPPTLEKVTAEATCSEGRNDLYTRLTRSVLLSPDDEEGRCVRFIRYAEGMALADDPDMPDPMVAYIEGKTSRFMFSFRKERALWRDLPVLLPDPQTREGLHPRVLDDAKDLLDDAGADGPLIVTVSGLACDQAKLVRWGTVSITLSRALLGGTNATSEILRRFILKAEETGQEMRKLAGSVFKLAFPKSRVRGSSLPASPVYFACLANQVPALLTLLSENAVDQANVMWAASRMDAARQAWAAIRTVLGSASPAAVALAKTEPRFERLLSGVKKQLSEIKAIKEDALWV